MSNKALQIALGIAIQVGIAALALGIIIWSVPLIISALFGVSFVLVALVLAAGDAKG